MGQKMDLVHSFSKQMVKFRSWKTLKSHGKGMENPEILKS